MRTEIIYEDNDILVIYKPAGLATQTAKPGQMDVVSELKGHLAKSGKNAGQASGRDIYLGIIHRLDQPVEGLLVFAKNKKSAADLTAQLQRQGENGSLHKHYYAVVCGKPAQEQGRLVDYMYKSPENLSVIVEKPLQEEKVAGSRVSGNTGKGKEIPQAKEAILEYRILERCQVVGGTAKRIQGNQGEAGETQIALADINIYTGRFHQIRAQMAHANLPLLGDAKYGSDEAKALGKRVGAQTVALCAYSLELKHPTTKKVMQFAEKPRGKAFGLF